MRESILLPSERMLEYFRTLCEYLNLPLLPYHIHKLLAALVFYQFLYIYLGPRISGWLAPKTYPNLRGRATLDWNIHVVSMTMATFISCLAQYVVLFDEERKRMTPLERAYGYTDLSATTLAIANGYFVWHFVMMFIHIRVYGFGMFAHACATLFLMLNGFRPAFLTYGVASYLYEWSNITLNIHRALSKLKMEQTKLYVANGIVLFIVFFFSRIIWGTYLTWWFYKDIWNAYVSAPPKGVEKLPTWLLVGHAASATMLQALNFIWFFLIARIFISRVCYKREKKWTSAEDE
ncbi:TLC domain-containing protein [Lophiotrema nucula]|uniref:TLC domain-containing protein n=1 Tax=Lophiotrema nucula TaxID=690887 RepID=A0A6A5Z054_9PLEO|nr:TLC domain-containing protein [Lophiotrema nucula]